MIGSTPEPRLRILMVTDSYPPLLGGATRAAQLLARGLAGLGHTVIVATAWQQGLPSKEEEEDGVHVHRLRDLTSRMPWFSADPYRHTPPPFPDLEAVWRFRRLLRRTKPDLVYAYGWLTYSCAAALLGSRVPLILAARDYGNICPKRTLMRNGHACAGPAPVKCLRCASGFYGPAKATLAVGGVLGGRRLLRRKMHGLQSCSRYVQDLMQRHLLDVEPIGDGRGRLPDVVIPDFQGVADTLQPPDSEILERLPDEPYLLFVGALRLIKGLEPLFAAYQRLPAPPPLVLIGTRAPDTPSEFPPGVEVLYNVPHATVMAAWDRALFGVAPSILPEPLGNVVHEAMSRGKAVIGTTPGGHADMIVDEVTGLIVPAGDVAALAAAMDRLIGDPVLRERMGKAGRQRARRFTSEVVLPQFDAFFQDVVRAGQR